MPDHRFAIALLRAANQDEAAAELEAQQTDSAPDQPATEPEAPQTEGEMLREQLNAQTTRGGAISIPALTPPREAKR